MGLLNFWKKRDIQPAVFPALDWAIGQRVASLTSLRNYAAQEAEEAASWYDRKRPSKRFMARVLRFSAILLTGLAGLIPLIGKWKETNGVPSIDPILSGVFVGIAGIAIVLDQFFGFSSAWVRYMKASQHIRRSLTDFRFDFDATRLLWDATAPSTVQCEACLHLCKSLVVEVDSIIQRETDQWVTEFQKALAQIESAMKDVAPHKPPGAIAVTVTNGDQCANGWEVSVDGGTKHPCRGKDEGITGVTAGIHNVSVVGDTGRGQTQSTKPVEVKDGQIAKVEFTL